MAILLFPTRRDLETDVVKGPVVIIEKLVKADASEEFYTSIYANHTAIDTKAHASLSEAVGAACERNRDGVRLKRPASFNPPEDVARASLDMGHVAPPPAAGDMDPADRSGPGIPEEESPGLR